MEFALCLLKEIDEEIDFFSFERERERERERDIKAFIKTLAFNLHSLPLFIGMRDLLPTA
jgi:hypothetical protein